MTNQVHNGKKTPLQVAWEQGKLAAWHNRWAGLCLWLFGVFIVLGYFFVPQVTAALEQIGNWKQKAGLLFSVGSTALFGGVLPVVLPLLLGKTNKAFWPLLMSNCLFWALKGIEIDLFYQVQAWLFGDNSDIQTVSLKVAVDQLIYAPFIGLFNCVLFYIWRDNQYSFKKTKASLGPNWYFSKVMPALISNWCVWLPSVIIIYLLPLALQLPVQNLILCFWVLVLVFFTSEQEDGVVDGSEDS